MTMSSDAGKEKEQASVDSFKENESRAAAGTSQSRRRRPWYDTTTNGNNNSNKIVLLSTFPDDLYFQECWKIPTLLIPAKRTAELRNTLRTIILHRPKLKSIQPTTQQQQQKQKGKIIQQRHVLLQEMVNGIHVHKHSLIQDILAQSSAANDNEENKIKTSFFNLEKSYKDWTIDEVFRALFIPPEDDNSKDSSSALPKTTTNYYHQPPSAFETVGHIAHVNLRDEWLPYQYIIGKVLLDKNAPRIQTVVNKVGKIHSIYRTFEMKVIAGRGMMDAINSTTNNNNSETNQKNNNDNDSSWSHVTVKEEGCVFEFDFRHVYWNSRLGGEHARLVKHIYKEATSSSSSSSPVIVADVMAGVGPFAIPLTATTIKQQQKQQKKKNKQDNNKNNKNEKNSNTSIVVHANDLNPDSFKYLEVNGKKNKCRHLHTYNLDGRAFVHQLQTNNNNNDEDKKKEISVDHFIMNLPASAPEFLDAFRGYGNMNNNKNDGIATTLQTKDGDNDNEESNNETTTTECTKVPMLHVYCFAEKNDDNNDNNKAESLPQSHINAIQRCSNALGCPIPIDTVNIHLVRDVAPKKNMLCLSFPLPAKARELPPIQLTPPQTATTRTTSEEDEKSIEPESKRAKLS